MLQTERDFCLNELERIYLDDDELTSLCQKQAKAFWPTEATAKILVRDEIISALRERKALSLLRVGNGEGNAVSMTKKTLHPLPVSTFYTEFLSQNAIPISQDAAVKFCTDVRTALLAADIIGFRSFRFDERAMIRESIDLDSAYAAMGFLYAREFLQDGLRQGHWLQTIITSAWTHLEIIPYLGAICEAADSIVVVTGRGELREQMRARCDGRLRAFITVPVQGSNPQSLEESHFAFFPAVREQLSCDLHGTLVLIGAGLFGKVYCHTARQHGAVAIDLGSAFDVLAGLNTRPIHKFYDIDAMRWL